MSMVGCNNNHPPPSINGQWLAVKLNTPLSISGQYLPLVTNPPTGVVSDWLWQYPPFANGSQWLAKKIPPQYWWSVAGCKNKHPLPHLWWSVAGCKNKSTNRGDQWLAVTITLPFTNGGQWLAIKITLPAIVVSGWLHPTRWCHIACHPWLHRGTL